MSLFKAGESAYLNAEITEGATGDHPAFLLGQFGEKVKIIEVTIDEHYPYLVEGPTNPGKPWKASADDLMFSKPMRGN